jgi:hypothetical protein
VLTRDVLSAAMPKPDAGFVVLHSSDGYTTNLTLAQPPQFDAAKRFFEGFDVGLVILWRGY